MQKVDEILKLLNEILQEADLQNKSQLIKVLQNTVWGEEVNENNAIDEILSDLAYDLDFYEPNEAFRNESSSYFGSKKLEDVIKSGIDKIKNLRQ